MIVIKNAKILTVTNGEINNGTVLVENGKIVAVGQNIPIPESAEVVDAAGKYLVPGFIDCHCHVGIVPEEVDWEYSDVNETTDPVTGHLRAIDGIDFSDRGFADAIDGGVTALLIHPGSANVIGGTDIAVKSWGPSVEDRILRNPAGMKMAWTAGGRRASRQGKNQPYPTTRMGVAAILRQYLFEAREYLKKKEAGQEFPAKSVSQLMTLEALAMVLKREIPARIHSMTPRDFQAIIRLQDEFGFDFTIEHGDEAHLIAPELAKRGIGVVYGPFLGDRWVPMFPNSNPQAAKILAEAGVLVAFQTDHPVISIRDLRLQAAICVKHGLNPDDALKMLTINAAKIMGLDKRIGSIEVGKDADFTIFSDHPLLVKSKVEQVYINGIKVK